jgi:glycosyltransferase involved in cell wall biosynthesis
MQMDDTGDVGEEMPHSLQGGPTSGEKVPAVSVCVPLYMKERFVAATIQSILDQTFSDFELVILNNASPDRSAEIAASFDDPRITLLHNTETVPAPENFARVLPLSRGPLVKFVAADDILHPTLLERQVAVLEDPDIALVSCRQNMVGEHGEIIYSDRSLRTPDLIGRRDRETVLRRVLRHMGNPVGAFVNVMFRRSAYEAAGGMPDAPFIALDMALWLEILRFGAFYGMEETLVDFRIADGSASAKNGRSGIDAQVRFIKELRRNNSGSVRVSDVAYGNLRTPLMRLRHQLIMSAAGPSDSARTRAATKVLSLSRGSST